MKKKKGGSTLPRKKKGFRLAFKSYWQLYVLVLPAVLYFLVFNYLPLYGIQIAFKDYKAVKGIAGSPWVGLKHFKNFFNAYYFDRLIINTLLLNILNLVFSFPVPLLLSILLNQIRKQKVKRAIQTTIYVPYFISTVVLAGMLYIFLSPTSGIFNHVRQAMGLNPIDYMSETAAFRPIYIISNIWQTAGYSTILYIATLTGIDLSLYEAADIDGASIWQKIRYIDLPTLQTSGNIPTSDILGVYVYTVGLGSGQFSYTSAIGLFVNVINFVMIILVNTISKKTADVGLF